MSCGMTFYKIHKMNYQYFFVGDIFKSILLFLACISYLLMYNKLSQNLVSKTTTNIYYLTQFLWVTNLGATELDVSDLSLL